MIRKWLSFRTLSIALALVLLVTAALKLHLLLTDPFADQRWSFFSKFAPRQVGPLLPTFAESPLSIEERASQRTIAYLGNRLFSTLGGSTGEVIHGISAFSQFKECASLISNRQFASLSRRLFDNESESGPRFARTRHGVRFLNTQQYKKVDGEAHPFQALAVLCGMDIDPDTQFSVTNSESFAFKELVSDCEAMFDLGEECEWSIIALIHADPMRQHIKNRFGREYTLNEIADHLFGRLPGTGSCMGCHLLEAMVLLELAGKHGNQFLSSENQAKITAYLDALQEFLSLSQLDDGGIPKEWGALWVVSGSFANWTSQWNIKSDWLTNSLDAKGMVNLNGDLLATSHHIHWIFQRASLEKSTRKFFEEANFFVYQSVSQILHSAKVQLAVQLNLCPLCHGFHALVLMNCFRTTREQFSVNGF